MSAMPKPLFGIPLSSTDGLLVRQLEAMLCPDGCDAKSKGKGKIKLKQARGKGKTKAKEKRRRSASQLYGQAVGLGA
jgi:hypothetical protein